MDSTTSKSLEVMNEVQLTEVEQVMETGRILPRQHSRHIPQKSQSQGQLQVSRLPGLVLHHDPSYSGEMDVYTYIILSQL